MPKIPARFDYKLSVQKTHSMQLRLSKHVIREDTLPKIIRYVAGVDTAYTDDLSIGATVVLDYSSLSVVESAKAKVKTRFPYIPTLLSFREIHPSLAAIKKLKTQPDVFLVDGQGIAHPYRLGFASHLGLVLDMPTIGVAKSLLCGRVGSFNSDGWAPITEKDEVLGAVVARPCGKPIFVSIGHKVSLDRALVVVRHCTLHHRVPEPIHAAHIAANEQKKSQKSNRPVRQSKKECVYIAL